MEAFLMLSDRHGNVQLDVAWGENGQPFDQDSPAHRMMAAMVRQADTLAERIPDNEPDRKPIAQAASKLVLVQG